MKAYDFVAAASGSNDLPMSKFLTAKQSLNQFPNMKYQRDDEGSSGETLKGSIVYLDGQFDDARLAVALATTASAAGATVASRVRVEKFVFEDEDNALSSEILGNPKRLRVIGAVVRDLENGGAPFTVKARSILNCTGPFTDSVRKMGDKTRENIMTPAGGTHVVLPPHFAPKNLGLIVPKTKDGRVVFMLPWLGGVLAGTTDTIAPITLTPKPTGDEVDFILEAIGPYLQNPAIRRDVSSAWSGIRPLAATPSDDSNSGKTENVSRDHVVFDENDGVVTVTGGKWTTYRLMAEHAVDAALKAAAVVDTSITTRSTPCVTNQIGVIGAHGYGSDLAGRLLIENGRAETGDKSKSNSKTNEFSIFTDRTVVTHLVRSYGDRATSVLALARGDDTLATKLVSTHPVLAAEVIHAARSEYCLSTRDFLARRSRLAFLDVRAASAAAPIVNQLLAKELGWGFFKARKELRETIAFLKTFSVE